jgi:hypothetical protein
MKEDRRRVGQADHHFTEAAPDDLPAVDAAYRAKYGGRYAGIVDHLLQEGPRSATLQVFPT